MQSKAQHAKRLVIYLLFAFGLAWIPWILMNRFWGYDEWFSTPHYTVFANLTLYAPAIANILTRLVTKEGFSDMKLHLRLKGHIPQYLLAWLFPAAAALAGGLLVTVLSGDFRGSGVTDSMSGTLIAANVSRSLFYAPAYAFFTFGEEFGWRGYMNDKLKPLCGTAGTVLLGGMIWGIWHAPLTVEGHNFGRDYAGYPYVGFLLMMAMCIVTGAILMWLTETSGSVYPAAVFHAMLNFGSPFLRQLLMRGIAERADQISAASLFAVLLLPAVPLGAVCFGFLLHQSKKKPAKAQ